MNLFKRILLMLGFGAVTASNAVAPAGDELKLKTTPDHPVPFGYKILWLAIRSDNPEQIIDRLHLDEPRQANWKSGIEAAYGDGADTSLLFVSPSLNNWVLVVGAGLPYPAKQPEKVTATIGKSFDLMFSSQVHKFEEVHFFGSHRVVSFVTWARARHGKIERVFSFADGQVLANQGAQTTEEQSLGFLNLSGLSESEAEKAISDHWEDQFEKMENHKKELVEQGFSLPEANRQSHDLYDISFPDESDPIKLAQAWGSLDPTQLDKLNFPTSTGWVTKMPNEWKH